jgi:hypothetical protein
MARVAATISNMPLADSIFRNSWNVDFILPNQKSPKCEHSASLQAFRHFRDYRSTNAGAALIFGVVLLLTAA